MPKKVSGIQSSSEFTAGNGVLIDSSKTISVDSARALAKNGGSDTYELGGSDTMMLFNTGSLLKIYSSDAETSTKLQLTGPSKIHCKNEAEVLMSSGSYITMNAAFGGNPMADIFQEPDFPKADNQGVLYHVKDHKTKLADANTNIASNTAAVNALPATYVSKASPSVSGDLDMNDNAIKEVGRFWGKTSQETDFRHLSPGQFFYGFHRRPDGFYKLPQDNASVDAYAYISNFDASTVLPDHINSVGSVNPFSVGTIFNGDAEHTATWSGNSLAFNFDVHIRSNNLAHGSALIDLGKSTFGLANPTHGKYVVSVARHADQHVESWINGQYQSASRETTQPLYRCVISPSRYMSLEFTQVDNGGAKYLRYTFEVKQAW